ncbi:MAG TPA: acyltransferase [Ktedonosporobacter sp.]|nr:acyltransferase [Ktedonosporobacter sp.]
MMGNTKLSISDLYASFRLHIQALSQSISQFLGDRKQKNAIPVLDGLRAIACLSVISDHMNWQANVYGIWKASLEGNGVFMSAASIFGESGVILFFLLSGFLLFLPYAKSLLFDSDWPSLRRFYTRRIFRILPGYYVALALLALFTAPQFLQQDHWPDLWLFLTMHMDFPATFQKLNGPFWTLAIEFRFYIVLPLIAWVMGLFVRRGPLNWRLAKLTCCLLVMLAWGLGTLYWGIYLSRALPLDTWFPHPVATTLTSYLFTAQKGKYFEVFAIGMLICMLYVYRKHAPAREHSARKVDFVNPLLFASGLVALGFMTLWRYDMLLWTDYGKYLSFFSSPFWLAYEDLFNPIGYAIGYGLGMFALLHGPAWLKRPFEWTPLRWIGLVSFSLYMWHLPIVMRFLVFILPTYEKLGWSQLAKGCAYWLWLFLTAFPASIILYRFVEMPGIRLGEHICRQWEPRKPQQDPPVPQAPAIPERILVAHGTRPELLPKD